jgi:hypothetical protein
MTTAFEAILVDMDSGMDPAAIVHKYAVEIEKSQPSVYSQWLDGCITDTELLMYVLSDTSLAHVIQGGSL